jgi:hypothetical protein
VTRSFCTRLYLCVMACYGVNTLSSDSVGKIIWVNQLNLSSSDMSSEIDPKNVIMVTSEEILKEQRKE